MKMNLGRGDSSNEDRFFRSMWLQMSNKISVFQDSILQYWLKFLRSSMLLRDVSMKITPSREILMYQKRAKTLKDIYGMENRLFLKNTKNKNLISFYFKLLK